MKPSLRSDLEPFARRFIWWKDPGEAVRFPRRVIAQVMDLGSLEDLVALETVAGTDALVETINQAEAGWFSPQSWHYWHYRLGLCIPGAVPPLPVRRFP